MRSAILLLVLSAAILGSCTSAYKTGQTPDDVYFSPERPQDKYVTVRDEDNNRYQGNDYYYDDQYLRMKVHNRMMWSELDDPYFYNPRYSYGYGYYNTWNPYTSWNYYYNPYCTPAVYTPKTAIAYNHPRVFNMNTYNGTQLTNSNSTKGSIYNSNNYNSRPVRIVGYTPSNNNNNSSSGAGNFLRNIFNSSSNNSSNSSSNNNSSFGSGNRSSSGSSGSSSSGSSGGGGGTAPARRF